MKKIINYIMLIFLVIIILSNTVVALDTFVFYNFTDDYNWYAGRNPQNDEARTGQSFIIKNNILTYNIQEASIYIPQKNAVDGWYWLEIREDDGNSPTGAFVKASNKVYHGDLNTGQWNNWSFINTTTIDNNTKYWLIFRGNETSGGGLRKVDTGVDISNPISNVNLEYYTSVDGWTAYTSYDMGLELKGKLGTNNFTIHALNYFNENIYNFSANIQGVGIFQSNISTGKIDTYLPNNDTSLYNFTLYSYGYINKTYLDYNISVDLIAYLEIYNSLNIEIKDEDNLSPIFEDVYLTFSSNFTSFNNVTNTSNFSYSHITNGNYTIFATATNYSNRSYLVGFNNSGAQNITIYLLKNSETVLFKVEDVDTGYSLENAPISMLRYLEGDWQIVESHFSDITGRASFQYKPNVNYKFVVSKTGYENKIFFLNPILFESYDINLNKIGSFYDVPPYTGVSILYNPRLFFAGKNNSFEFIIHSPAGILNEYGFTLDYQGGNITRTGNNNYGGDFETNFIINNISMNDVLNLTYYYDTTIAGRSSFSFNYEVIAEGWIGNNTLIQNKNKTYGLGLFERVLIATFIVIFIAGIGSLIAGGIVGFFLALMMFGILMYIGFIPIWSIIISLLVGFLVLMWRAEL